MLVWLVWQLEESMERALRIESWRRLGLVAGLAAGVVLSLTSDRDGRWSGSLQRDYLSASEPGIDGWLPEPGGIIYNMQMGVFYKTFFKNPHGQWRYLLGFEPILMPKEYLAVYRKILLKPDVRESYEPWLKTLRRGDRIIVEANAPLPLPELEWRKFGQATWIGRWPASTNAPSPRATVATATAQ
jgi:hypothetical protein